LSVISEFVVELVNFTRFNLIWHVDLMMNFCNLLLSHGLSELVKSTA